MLGYYYDTLEIVAMLLVSYDWFFRFCSFVIFFRSSFGKCEHLLSEKEQHFKDPQLVSH